MTLEGVILSIVGAVVQLFIKYIPKFSDWYEKQEQKALIAMGLVLVVSLAYFGLGCTSLAETLGIQVACTKEGAFSLVGVFVSILIGQQTTYLLTRKSG